MTDNTKMREAFEKWATDKGYNIERWICGDHMYANRGTQEDWEVWQAAQSVPEEKLDFEKLESLGWQIAICAMCGTHASAIKSSTFGRTELSGLEAARFIRHMNEDAPKSEAKAAFARGRELLKKLKRAAIAQGKGE